MIDSIGWSSDSSSNRELEVQDDIWSMKDPIDVKCLFPKVCSLEIGTSASIDSIGLIAFPKGKDSPSPLLDPKWQGKPEKSKNIYQVRVPLDVFQLAKPDDNLWISGCENGKRQFTIVSTVQLLQSGEMSLIHVSKSSARR